MDSNLRPLKSKNASADNSHRRNQLRHTQLRHTTIRYKIICYYLFNIFLFIVLSTVTKFTQYIQSARLLHHYFHKLFLLFNYNLTSKL